MIKTVLIMALVASVLAGMITGSFGSAVAIFIIVLLVEFLLWGAILLLKWLMK